MIPVSLPSLPEDRKWVVHSTSLPLFFENEYDERQLWLPFVEHVYFQVSTQEETSFSDLVKSHNASKEKLTRGKTRKYALNSEEDRYVYLWKRNYEQRVLPFPEHRLISNRQWARLQREGCPGWDRDEKGLLLEILAYSNPVDRHTMAHHRRTNVVEWCQDNTRGCFHVTASAYSVVFERSEDAMLFKLSFQV